MEALSQRPILWFIVLTGAVSALMRAFPAYNSVGLWFISALAILMATIMVVRPEQSGFHSHPTGVRLAGIFILCVWAFLLVRDLIKFVQGA